MKIEHLIGIEATSYKIPCPMNSLVSSNILALFIVLHYDTHIDFNQIQFGEDAVSPHISKQSNENRFRKIVDLSVEIFEIASNALRLSHVTRIFVHINDTMAWILWFDCDYSKLG